MLDLAHEIKAGRWRERPLEGAHMAMLFQKPSHRTRVSFEVGIARLGGSTTTLSEQDVQLGAEGVDLRCRARARPLRGRHRRPLAHA